MPVEPVRLKRRNVLSFIGYGALAATGIAGFFAVEWVQERGRRSCQDCAKQEATATAAVQKVEKFGGTLMTIVDDSVSLSGDTPLGIIIAPPGSTMEDIKPLPVGKVMVLAVGEGEAQDATYATMQDGVLNGDISSLRERAKTSPFHDYTSDGHSGQILILGVDADRSHMVQGTACNKPLYCLRPGSDGTPHFRAFTISQEVYKAHKDDIIHMLEQEQDIGLGKQPELTELSASQIQW